ncbi:MAG: fatty acid desaturase [Actinomycetota bacterium]|nr:fatty acid desaturase [Actinomycetota bacterium]
MVTTKAPGLDPKFVEASRTMTGGMAPTGLDHFVGSDRLRPDGRPLPHFRAELRGIPNARNVFTCLTTLAYPLVIVGVAISISHPIVWVAAFALMGSVFARFAILNHEAAHRLLFSNKRFNDFVGQWIFGWLAFGSGSDAYRRSHASHHRDEFGPKEPDFLLYALYPIPKDSFRRKLTRDAFFVSGYKNFASYFRSFTKRKTLKYGIRTTVGQLVVLAIFAAIGRPELWVLLWLMPYMTIWRVFNRLRAIAEHGGMRRSADRRHTTHHVEQHLLAKFWFVPFNTGLHLAHHVDSGVPFRNLTTLHQALVDDGYVTDDIVYPNYPSLWRALVRS